MKLRPKIVIDTIRKPFVAVFVKYIRGCIKSEKGTLAERAYVFLKGNLEDTRGLGAWTEDGEPIGVILRHVDPKLEGLIEAGTLRVAPEYRRYDVATVLGSIVLVLSHLQNEKVVAFVNGGNGAMTSFMEYFRAEIVERRPLASVGDSTGDDEVEVQYAFPTLISAVIAARFLIHAYDRKLFVFRHYLLADGDWRTWLRNLAKTKVPWDDDDE